MFHILHFEQVSICFLTLDGLKRPPRDVAGMSFSVSAGRISYALGLKGPSYIVDTACSSAARYHFRHPFEIDFEYVVHQNHPCCMDFTWISLDVHGFFIGCDGFSIASSALRGFGGARLLSYGAAQGPLPERAEHGGQCDG